MPIYKRQWREEAICVGKPRSWFFEQHQFPNAKKLCVQCPVRLECLTEAIQNDEAGIWGGLSEIDRRIILKRSMIDRVPIAQAAQRFFNRERP